MLNCILFVYTHFYNISVVDLKMYAIALLSKVLVRREQTPTENHANLTICEFKYTLGSVTKI